MRHLVAAAALLLAAGCATVEAPDGTSLMAFGQSRAIWCPVGTEIPVDPNAPIPGGCYVAEGGPLSTGFVAMLQHALSFAVGLAF